MKKRLQQKSGLKFATFFLLTSFTPLMGINTQTELTNALNSGSGTYTLAANITLAQTTSIPSGGTITINGGGYSVNGDILNLATVQFTGSTTYYGNMSGNGVLSVATGTLTLAGMNSYSGGTTVGSGSTLVGDYLSLQRTINNSGLVVINQPAISTAHIFNGSLAGTGDAQKKGDGELDVNGVDWSISGTTDIFEGKLVFNIPTTFGGVGFTPKFKTTQTGSGDFRPELALHSSGSVNATLTLNITNVGSSGFVLSSTVPGNGVNLVNSTFTSIASDKLFVYGDAPIIFSSSSFNSFHGQLELDHSPFCRFLASSGDSILGGVSKAIFNDSRIEFNLGAGANTSSAVAIELLSESTSYLTTQSNSFTLSGNITGSGNLYFTPSNDLRISGSNVGFSGKFGLAIFPTQWNTSVGNLIFPTQGSLGNASLIEVESGNFTLKLGAFQCNTPINIGSSATSLNLSPVTAGSTITLAGAISGEGTLNVKMQSGKLDISTRNPGFLGNLALVTGTLRFTNKDTSIGSGTLIPSSGTTTELFSNMVLENEIDTNSATSSAAIIKVSGGIASITGDIKGNGKLQKTGSGELDLLGENTTQNWTLDVSEGSTLGEYRNYPNYVSIERGAAAYYHTPAGTNIDLLIDNLSNLTGLGGTFHKSGSGTLNLTKKPNGTFTGVYSIDAGATNINGDFSSNDFSIGQGALFNGQGTIKNLTNEGNVRPGNSIGTMNIVGNYIQSATGDYLVEIESSGGSDLLNITGNATIDGTLTIIEYPGYYPVGARFVIMNFGGSLSGTFDDVVHPRDELFKLWYGNLSGYTNSIVLEILNSHFVLPVPNQDLTGYARAVADDLWCGSLTPDVPEPGLLEVLIGLVELPADQYRQALVTIANGQISNLTIQEAENNFRILQSSMLRWDRQDNRICYSFDQLPRTTLWLNPMGFGMWQNSRQDCSGFFSTTYGFTGGGEYNLTDVSKLGLFAGYSQTSQHWKNGVGKTTNREGYLGPYYTATCGGWNFAGAVMGSIDAVQINRVIYWNHFSAIAVSNPLLFNATVNLDTAYRFQVATPVYLEPQAGLGVVQTFRSSFTEKGGSYFNTYVDTDYEATLRGSLRLNLGTNTCTTKNIHGDMRVTIGAIFTGLLSKNTLRSNFMQANDFCHDDLDLYGQHPSAVMFEAGARAAVTYKENFKFGLDADTMIGDRSQVLQGTLFFEVNF